MIQKSRETIGFLPAIFYLRANFTSMKFKPGDKVKFLNEKGGGIVSRIINPAMVEVSIEEGFDVPVKISDIILVDASDANSRLFNVEYDVERPQAQESPTVKADDQPAPVMFVAKDQPEGIYLAVKPHDQKLLIAGYADVILINHTGSDILYNLYVRSGGVYEAADYGSVGPRSTALLDTCDRKTLENYMDGEIQLMFHASDVAEVPKPLAIPYKVKSSRLVSEGQYCKTSFMSGRILTVQLCQLPTGEGKVIKKPVVLKPTADRTLIERHRVEEGFAEVDLHIEKLVEDLKSLQPAQAMTVQLDYLKRTLESAIAANYERVVFIHGVGAGVLKIEIRKILDAYEFLEYFDASIAKYGIGATEVLIHKKK